VDRDTFLDVLRQSRLLSDQQVAAVANEFSGREASQAIATSLISRGWLTPFQARRLAEGQGAGLVLGQYHLLEEAGQGGFGRVYKALHAVMGRVVAVKVISPEAAEEAQARSWFKREVRAATQLYHPNIVMAYDANEAEGLLFLVMEYVDGSDLETLVKCQGPLPVGLACEMMRQAARALQYARPPVRPSSSRSSISAWPGCTGRPAPTPSHPRPRSGSSARRTTSLPSRSGTPAPWTSARTCTVSAARSTTP
jgi:hypothetical protein